jgi:hypothetical protein|tara:strand:- start:15 stop:980 length:966 start_codon:yes stop_codon:yes gene_type:complete
MLTIKKNKPPKQIQKISFPIDLRRKPNVVVRKILEWGDVRNHPNLSHMKTLERNYIRPVITMMGRIGLPNDRFYTVKIRENRATVTDYWRNTFKGGTAHMHVSHFIGLMSVFDDRFTTDDLNFFKKFQKETESIQQANPSDRSLVSIPDWEETRSFLSTIKNGMNKPLAVLATLYYHGYVLRHGIVLETIIIDGDPDEDSTEPSLNLETGRYYIPRQKSDGADFIIFDDCLDDLRALSIPTSQTNPLSRRGADRLVSCSPTIVKRKFKGIYATSIIRKSFIRWYYKHSGRTIEDIDKLSKIIGNTVFTMYKKYLGEQEKMI